MKNYLKYYYGIDADNIGQNNNNYLFKKDDYTFLFFSYNGNLNNLKEVYEFCENLIYYGYYCNQIILNLNSEIYTIIDNKCYVLIKYRAELNKKIQINSIFPFNNLYIKTDKLRSDDWKRLWENKIDYFEYQLNQLGINHPLIRESFGYYSGYVETGIQLLNELNIKNANLVLSHKRINYLDDESDLYNPFNFVVDYRPRDAAEYFKSLFLQKKNIISDIIIFLNNSNYNISEYQLFFVRMLYPSFYFDVFEIIMNNNQNDDLLKNILEFQDEYENLIKRLYSLINNVAYLPRIDWLMY